MDKLLESTVNLLNTTSDKVLKHQANFEEIEKGFEKLNNKINTVMSVQTLLFTVLIASSEGIKNTLKESLNLLKAKQIENKNLMTHVDLLLKYIEYSNDVRDGKKTFPFLDLIPGGKKDE